MIKALFLDIDGTLVSFETHRVGEPTRNALAEARRRGLLLFIATGRHRCDLNNLGDLAFDGYVTLNGQYCYDARGVYRRAGRPMRPIRRSIRSGSISCGTTMNLTSR